MSLANLQPRFVGGAFAGWTLDTSDATQGVTVAVVPDFETDPYAGPTCEEIYNWQDQHGNAPAHCWYSDWYTPRADAQDDDGDWSHDVDNGLAAETVYRLVACDQEGQGQELVYSEPFTSTGLLDEGSPLEGLDWLPSPTGGTPTVNSNVSTGRVAYIVSEDELTDQDVIDLVEDAISG